MAKTISEKILSAKSGVDAYAGQIVEAEIDYVMANDVTAPLAFQEFEALGCDPVREKIVLVPDHFVPNKDIASAEQAALMRRFVQKWGLPNYFEVGRGGVCHQVMVDEGFAAPGRLIVGADSHTCTYGGINAFSTGIGSTEAAACFAEGRLWFKVPEAMNVHLTGKFNKQVSGKDLILKIISDIGVDGANYKAFEFSGPGVASVPVHDRLTISNMAIEAGGKAGIFPCDQATEAHLKGRVRGEYTPVSADEEAQYASTLEYDLGELDYMVAFPHLPSNGRLVSEVDVPIDQAFLGSCTNGRIEDMRVAAAILKGRKVHRDVRMIVVPASTEVYQQAMDEGLLSIFTKAGAFVSGPTCAACLGGHMGVLAKGEKCVSSTNRNFIGRMGHRDSEVYLAGPAVVAASAVAGKIVSPEVL
ncbi:MAG TPA: 3-isopropylmalate dehydratase large subunit [Methanomassiliicoccaceae archaeon]|jgi:3-isopropylmalate/(R)-2-methylmalate dehydratase large subunit|nr:3-isopropylmalate dehydratase large subunit [Euryarchaeota archaeon]HOB38811.1 3-isopropylmalate dehydratase large subunit [Methanomassiliicoccaceae archaeon]HOK27545.1 3-isopropylmalate dehydratase large subunit [Methanomassiliicoccaceae archaeon]HOQ25187.1 3-isopropylmalate dehydratase large subunit [Methanomassiliicoccaceae archaeon]HQA21273.1 3-isopropylmalate dehydratase large subunit [Methanomassiliicoccaceae archaeon]